MTNIGVHYSLLQRSVTNTYKVLCGRIFLFALLKDRIFKEQRKFLENKVTQIVPMLNTDVPNYKADQPLDMYNVNHGCSLLCVCVCRSSRTGSTGSVRSDLSNVSSTGAGAIVSPRQVIPQEGQLLCFLCKNLEMP